MGNHTSSPAAKEIQFTIVTSKEDAQRALDAAEADDAYLEQCSENKTNTKARQGMNYHANRMTYRELKMFEIVLENARSQIPRRLKEDLKEVKLIQLMPSADGGMPHTRPGGLICYPDLSRFFTTSTLIHELWHLHQRAYESQWTTIFHGLGWKEWRGDLPSALNRHRRYNPDTIPSPSGSFKINGYPSPSLRICLRLVYETLIYGFMMSTQDIIVNRYLRRFVHDFPLSLPLATNIRGNSLRICCPIQTPIPSRQDFKPFFCSWVISPLSHNPIISRLNSQWLVEWVLNDVWKRQTLSRMGLVGIGWSFRRGVFTRTELVA